MSVQDALALTAIAISVGAAWISVWSFLRGERTSQEPVLVFAQSTDTTLWVLHNVGKGPAMDVLVGDGTRDGEWAQIARCNPIAAGASVDLPWLRHAWELATTYVDVTGRQYTSSCKDHRTTIDRRNKFPDWKPDDREYNLRKMVGS